jgi:hypothetical protein
MKRKFLISLTEKLSANAKEPWACFETTGVGEDGRVEFSISCNKAFIANLHKNGFQGINDEETAQMFFLSARMLPEELMHQGDTINPEATPNLTNEANTLRR